MTKKWIWLILLIIVAVALWYWWKSGTPAVNLPGDNQTTNEISNQTGDLPVSTSRFSSELAGIIREATAEQTAAGLEAGEIALVASVSQQVSDLNQAYDESKF